MIEHLDDDTYTGPRFRYASRNRPFGYGTCPSGFILCSDRPHPSYRYGTRDYPAPLSAADVYAYELILIDAPAPTA